MNNSKRRRQISGTLALLFCGLIALPAYAIDEDVSQDKALIRKIVTAPEYQRYLRDTDDIVRNAARSGMRAFLNRLWEFLQNWNIPARELPAENNLDADEVPSPDLSVKLSSGFLAELLDWLSRLDDVTLSLFILIPLTVLLAALLYALLRQGFKMRRAKLELKKSQTKQNNDDNLREIFEKLLSQVMYAKADPRLLPPALTHRQVNARLRDIPSKRECWNQILYLMELYRFSPGKQQGHMRQQILAILQKLHSKQ